MIVKEYLIANEHGLHARPASLFSSTCAKFQSDIRVRCSGGDMTVDAKAVVSVLMLRVRPGTSIELIVSGSDEQEAINAIDELVSVDFNI